jgi:hypothetical protein
VRIFRPPFFNRFFDQQGYLYLPDGAVSTPFIYKSGCRKHGQVTVEGQPQTVKSPGFGIVRAKASASISSLMIPSVKKAIRPLTMC